MGTVIVQTICALVGVCALATVLLRVGGARFGGSGADSPMRIVGRLPLEPRRALLVVRVGQRTMMLATSESGIQPVGELTGDEARDLERMLASPNVSRETPEVVR